MSGKILASVIIMTKNEESNIRKCLNSVQDFDQVFVIDSQSEDNTCKIAESLGAEIVNFIWNGRYPKKKQWCLDNLQFKYDWVLYVDADEEIYPELAQELGSLLNAGPGHAGYFVGSDYVFCGKVLKYGHRIYKLIFFNRHKGRFIDYDDLDITNMWEVEGHYQPNISGSTKVLEHSILHDDHNSLYDYFSRHNRYSDWEATLRSKNAMLSSDEAQPGMRKHLKRIFSKMPFKGLVAFVHSYLVHLGFLDGIAGFNFALARGFYYWQIGIKQQEIIRTKNGI